LSLHFESAMKPEPAVFKYTSLFSLTREWRLIEGLGQILEINECSKFVFWNAVLLQEG
jgi:hypothetical protein